MFYKPMLPVIMLPDYPQGWGFILSLSCSKAFTNNQFYLNTSQGASTYDGDNY